MAATIVQATADGVRITRHADTPDEQVIVLSYAELACAANAARKHLLPLVPCEVPGLVPAQQESKGE